MLRLFAVVGAASALSSTKARPVVAFELDGVLWDAETVRTTAGQEVKGWLSTRLGVDPLDIYEEEMKLKEQGSQFGMLQPGIMAVAKETMDIVVKASGAVEEESVETFCTDALVMWLQAHDAAAEENIDKDAVDAIAALKATCDCCGVTSSIGDSARMPSLIDLFDSTLNTYDFTVPSEDAWYVTLQVAAAKYMGRPLFFVGGGSEGGLASAAKAGWTTIAVGGDAPTDGPQIASLRDLPEAIERLL